MIRMIAVLAASTALAGCAPDRGADWRRAIRLPPSPSRCPTRRRRPSRNMALLASTSPAWTRASRPGDNFYQYANGTWAKNTPIPADKSNYGSFNMLDDLSRERTRDNHRASRPRTPTAGSARPMRASWTQPAIEAKGLAPIQPWLDQIRGLKSQAGLAAPCTPRRTGSASAARSPAVVGQDDKEPDVYALNVSQGGPRHARPRLLSVERRQAGRDAGSISRAYRPRC